MASVPYSSTLQLSNPNALFSSSPASLRTSFPLKLHAPPQLSFTTCRATANDSSDSSETESDQIISQTETSVQDDDFDSKLSQIRLRYRSGQGKKAEVRKTKKGKKSNSTSTSTSGSGSGIYLPPVPLKQPVSGGVNVELGFSPYSERINGRIAIVGLMALVLVELATGKGVINYHTPPIILIQLYFMASASALFVKFQKEKVSVWPQSSSTATNK